MAFTGMGSGNDLEVVVGGDSSGATRALGNLRGSLVGTAGKVAALGAALGGALAVGGLAKAAQAAADFEEAMVEVEKVTDPQTAMEMSDSIRELAETIPIAQEELAAMAADAARFGIRGSENIENFTETVAKMATATDLSSQEAGEAFARLATLTETPAEEMENLGSSINELSNNMATSAGEIVDSMLRASAGLTQFGLSNTEIVAMSAALNEVSESSERAGSRLRRLAQELLDPGKVEDLASALGMTEEEFRNIRRERPDDLMMQIVRAFARGSEEADALRGVLSTTSRQAVAGLAQNLDGLQRALDQSNSSFEAGTSLQEEFDAATDTFNARLRIARNRINNIAIAIGNELLPVLNPLLEDVNQLLKDWRELSNTAFSDETASQIQSIAKEFTTLADPIANNAEEVVELGGNLWTLSQEILPLVTPALRDLRFVLVTTADALDTINDSLSKAIELWNKLPEPVREAAIRSATELATAPVGGTTAVESFRTTRRGFTADQPRLANQQTAQFGPGQQEVVLTVEGDNPLADLIRQEIDMNFRREERAADRLEGRGTGAR